MKALKSSISICLAATLLGGLSLVSGCAKEKKPAPVAQAPAPKAQPVGLAQIKSELLESKAQIRATTEALNTLQKSTTPDAQANYNKFTEEYLKLQAKADAVKARAEDLKAKTSAYYALWNKQIEVENPELRRQALQQKADAERVYNSIASEMEMARTAFNPYMTNLKDVGNYLRGNLSPASLQSVSDLTAKASSQAQEVGTHVDAIVVSIDKMAAATGEGTAGATVPPDAPAAPAAK